MEDLWKITPQAAARITVLLEEVEGDQDLLDRLTQHGYGSDRTEDFHVSKWFEHWNKRKDIWRLKIWDLEDAGLKYRIVYAYIPKIREYHILAIAPRAFNYEATHPLTQRLLKAYEDL